MKILEQLPRPIRNSKLYKAIFVHEHEKKKEVAKRWSKNIGTKKCKISIKYIQYIKCMEI